jgi:hypothetical protein
MSFEDLQISGQNLAGNGAAIFFTFCCPVCDEPVSIKEPGRLPDTASHETCGTEIDVRSVGGWWEWIGRETIQSGPPN